MGWGEKGIVLGLICPEIGWLEGWNVIEGRDFISIASDHLPFRELQWSQNWFLTQRSTVRMTPNLNVNLLTGKPTAFFQTVN